MEQQGAGQAGFPGTGAVCGDLQDCQLTLTQWAHLGKERLKLLSAVILT